MKAKFVKSCMAVEDLPKDGLPEVAVVGRSNVGKSSLLNFLFQTKGLAKTSAQPGKTRLINFFESGGVYFVDLPGWGYAKASKTLREEWGELVEHYLETRKTLVKVLFLLDIRREPNEEDIALAKWFEDRGLEVIYVVTKSDKANQSEKVRQARHFEAVFGKEPVITSSVKGSGREFLIKRIYQ